MSLLKWEVRPIAGEETGNRKRERGQKRVVEACTCLRVGGGVVRLGSSSGSRGILWC